MKKRILVLFPNVFSVEGFNSVGAFKNASEAYELYGLVHHTAADIVAPFSGFEAVRVMAKRPMRSRHKILLMNMWTERQSTAAFEDTALKTYRIYTINGGKRHGLKMFFLYTIPGYFRPLGRLIKAVMEWSLGTDPEIDAAVADINPDLIIIPTYGGLHPADIDMIKVARRRGIKTLYLQANWEPFSARGRYDYFADYAGVWGYQSAVWTEKIQGLHKKRIFMLGAPAIEELWAAEGDLDAAKIRRDLGVPDNKRVILLFGAGRPTAEVDTLLALEDQIESGQLEGYVVFYRPHPYRVATKGERNPFEMKLKHVIIDPTIYDRYRGVHRNGEAGPMAFDGYFRNYVHNRRVFHIADVGVGHGGTITVEATACGVPLVNLGYADCDNLIYLVRYDFANTASMQSMPGVLTCPHPSALAETIKKCVAVSQRPGFKDTLAAHHAAIVYRDSLSYGERLMEGLSAIFGETTTSFYGYLGESIMRVDNVRQIKNYVFDRDRVSEGN